MKKLTKKIAGIVAVATLAGAFSGCSFQTSKKDTVAKLHYVMAGPGMQEDCNLVWDKLNDKLEEDGYKINMSFEVIPLSEYKQKFMLMTSAREKIDIANNYGLDFSSEVRNGTFTPLDDLLKDYGKETVETLPDWLMDYQKIDGKVYGIPSYQMCANMRAIVFFKDEAEKYLDIEKFKKVLYSKTTFDNKELYDMLEEYMATLKKNGINFKDATILNTKGHDSFVSSYGVDEGNETKVINYAIDSDAKFRYSVASDWFKKGYIRPDILSVKDRSSYQGKIGGYAFWDEGWTPFVEKTLSEKYDKPVITIPYSDKYYITRTNTAGGTSITETCKDKEKAMQFINLVQTDKDYYNMLTFGIEGNHYEKVGDDKIQTPYGAQGTSNERYGIYKWIVGNTSLAYNTQDDPDEYKTWVFDEVNSSDYRSPLIGFTPDTTNIQDYITQVSAVRGKYYQSLADGALPDWEATYEQFKKELDDVGNQEIIDELQKQLDAFLKSKK